MDAGSRTDSFDALLVELVGELDATHPALSDLGRFEVTATLGEGGFGSVYAATDRRDGRQVVGGGLRGIRSRRPAWSTWARYVEEFLGAIVIHLDRLGRSRTGETSPSGSWVWIPWIVWVDQGR